MPVCAKKLHTAINMRRSKFASFLTSRSGQGGRFYEGPVAFFLFFILFYLHKSWWAGSIWMGLIMGTKCPGPNCDRVFVEEYWTNEIQTPPQHTSACQGEIVLCTYEEINSEQNVKIPENRNSRVHWVYVKRCNPTRYETDVMHFRSFIFYSATHVRLIPSSAKRYSVFETFNRCSQNPTQKIGGKVASAGGLLHFSTN